MQKNWSIKHFNKDRAETLSKELNLSLASAQVLISRGIDSLDKAQRFLKSGLSDLSSPFDIPDMKKAVARVLKAKEKNELIFLFGDYDVDGITSVVLLKSLLLKEGFHVIHYLPHRVNDGYGLNKKIVKLIIEKKANLVITVDCGTTNVEEIKALKDAGIDTVVIDHHMPSKTLPNAAAIVNPKLKEKHLDYLAGVGVVFKFACALSNKFLKEDLDLVCLGTISDVMPLVEENRIIVKEGLSLLKQTEKEGLKALFEQARIDKEKITTGYVSYIIGPRINASGRIDSPEVAFRLLISDNASEAKEIAKELEKHNQARQKIESKILEEALALIEQEVNFCDQRIIVVAKDGWHRGVLGIIASRITERFYRPTIIISLDDLKGRGSARSIKNFHMLNALNDCSHHLEGFGGHAHAAGLDINKDNIPDFRHSINNIAKDVLLDTDLLPQLDIDAKINLNDLSQKMVAELDSFSPYGVGNPRPIFATTGLKLKSVPAILGRDTLKFWVTDGKLTYSVIGFGKKDLIGLVTGAKTLDIAYYPSLDGWRGEPEIQLNLEDVRIGI